MDKNIKEKELLFQWACKCDGAIPLSQKIFMPIKAGEESYFAERDSAIPFVREWDFQDLPDLEIELEKTWFDEHYMHEIIKTILVGAYKNYIEPSNESEVEAPISGGKELPNYIYNF